MFGWSRQWMTIVMLAVLACTGCAAPVGDDGEHTATTQEAITNGEDDDKDPSVVALLQNGTVYCSGVLITSHVVLTAAHCVDPTPPDQVLFGSKLGAKGAKLVGVSDAKSFPDFDEATLENDVGLVGLAEQAPATPLPVHTAEMDASSIGMPIRLVGYGVQSANDDGNIRKRSGTTKIESYDDDTFKFTPGPSQTCSGDSGGPAFATVDGKETVVGITSSGDVDCKTYGQDMRVDRYVPFITSFAKAYSAKVANPSNAGCSTAPGGVGDGSWLVLVACMIFWRRRTMCAREAPSSRGVSSACASATFSA